MLQRSDVPPFAIVDSRSSNFPARKSNQSEEGDQLHSPKNRTRVERRKCFRHSGPVGQLIQNILRLLRLLWSSSHRRGGGCRLTGRDVLRRSRSALNSDRNRLAAQSHVLLFRGIEIRECEHWHILLVLIGSKHRLERFC